MKWYFEVLRKYAVFSGRAQRKEYWMFFLFYIIIAVTISFVGMLIGFELDMGTKLSDFASLLYNLAILIPSIAVGIRRMHDIGRSGWWLIVPIVGFVFLFFDSQFDENEYGPNPKLV